ncbi:hypothetical protein EV182_000913 [Spiromyces aspiralis]|uniref:Uncharacterized protein n=1 Tax=Spiromyces aspiralis TaxID=68401 RepID=A0ACC1HIR2_9FUNG|nr:hypothetical protein EV182_000913 [Spiromyces aspiralis]
MSTSMLSPNSSYRIDGATPEQQALVDELASSFFVSDEKIASIIETFRQRMREGLQADGLELKMIPAFIPHRPTGRESGSFFAIDLGGTNLRILRVTLKGNSQVDIEPQKYTLSEEAKSGPLFDFVAEKIGAFLDERGLLPAKDDPPIPMGFTFSYPVNQTSLTAGTLMHWTKGITAPNCVGRDVVRLLHDSLLRRHIKVNIVAMLNDTVSTLLGSAYMHPGTQMGVIFGTGTNAAYYERLDQIPKFCAPLDDPAASEMILNIEWGGFDTRYSVLPATMHDIKLNRKSPNPFQQAYEKMISGLYLGEIVRNAALYMVDQRLLFNGRSSSILNEMWSIDTMYLTEAISDSSSDLSIVKDILEKTLGLDPTSLLDRRIFRAIAIMVGERASRLSSVGLVSTLLQRPELLEKHLIVGIDGSMYEFLPQFEERVYDTLRRFLSPDQFKNIRLILAKDCSSVGSAIAAMFYGSTRK